MDELILKMISEEIETKFNVKVLSIGYAELLSLCVRVKIQFKIEDDYLYRPFDRDNKLPTPDSICFSERWMTFTRRVDLYECVRKNVRLN